MERQTAKVIQIKSKNQEVVIINNYRFIKSVIVDMATGEIDKRRRCPVCGGRKNPHDWVCSKCAESAPRPAELIAAAKKGVIQFGGKIRPKNRPRYLLTREEENEVREVAKGWLKEHPEATQENFLEAIASLFPHLSSKAQALEKVLVPLYNKHQEECEDWRQAQELAKQWFDDYPDTLNCRPVDIADKLISFLGSKGKLIRAVTEEQKRRRRKAWQEAKEIAQKYWATFPEDDQPPEKIAKSLAPDIPVEMLAKALVQEKERMIAHEREKALAQERERLAALARQKKPLNNHPRINLGKKKKKGGKKKRKKNR